MGYCRVSFVALLAFGLTACSERPHIRYQRLSDTELLEQSPIILVGRIDKRETFSDERVRQGDENGQPLYWFHVNIRANVENILRGNVSDPVVEYTYGIPVGSKTGEWNNPIEGSRYIHFLRREGSGLRAVVDFWKSTIHLTTGLHRSVPGGERLAKTIAYLLLVPGDEFIPEQFNPLEGYVHASGLIGDPSAFELVTKLVQHDDKLVRAGACQLLADGGVAPMPSGCASSGLAGR
jgi:hypothetical protein